MWVSYGMSEIASVVAALEAVLALIAAVMATLEAVFASIAVAIEEIASAMAVDVTAELTSPFWASNLSAYEAVDAKSASEAKLLSTFIFGCVFVCLFVLFCF